jgi:hypothetical protein
MEVKKVKKAQEGGQLMKVTISFDKKQDAQSGNWLGCNLSDMAYALDKRLKKSHGATTTARFSPNRLELDITGADQSAVKPLMVAFQESMARDGFRLLITYA